MFPRRSGDYISENVEVMVLRHVASTKNASVRVAIDRALGWLERALVLLLWMEREKQWRRGGAMAGGSMGKKQFCYLRSYSQSPQRLWGRG